MTLRPNHDDIAERGDQPCALCEGDPAAGWTPEHHRAHGWPYNVGGAALLLLIAVPVIWSIFQ